MTKRLAAWGVMLTIAVLACSGLSEGAGDGHMTLKADDVKWADAPPVLPAGSKIAWLQGDGADAKPFAFRVKLPANSKIAPHFHSAAEHVTVLSGTFNLGVGEKFDMEATKPLPAGSFAVLQPKTPHFVSIKEETVVQVHGVGPWTLTFVNPADDPRKK